MILDFLSLGGYGQFVWPAFIFAFMSYLTLYLKVKKELKKNEKIFFSKFKSLAVTKTKIIHQKRTQGVKILSGSTSI
tara:strand:- start:287 stop:517 length:231 start_codon:yes stop_codon:yes gene_type:complete